MKKLKTISAAVLAAISLISFNSCGNDDEPTTPAAQHVAGTYKGDMTLTVSTSTSDYEDMTFVITATDESTVSITTPAFGEAPMAMPSVTINGVKVSGTDGTYTLAQTSFDFTTDAGKACKGAIKGDYVNGKLTIDYTLKYGNMPFDMICKFQTK